MANLAMSASRLFTASYFTGALDKALRHLHESHQLSTEQLKLLVIPSYFRDEAEIRAGFVAGKPAFDNGLRLEEYRSESASRRCARAAPVGRQCCRVT